MTLLSILTSVLGGYGFHQCLCVCLIFHMISQKLMQLESPNVMYKCSMKRSGNPFITGRLMGQYCFARWRLSWSSDVVVCNTAGGQVRRRSGSRHCMVGQSCYVPLGRHLVFGFKRSKVKVTRHKKHCTHGSLNSCECWLVIRNSPDAFGDSDTV